MTGKENNWKESKRYNDFSSHVRRTFSHRVQKVSIDAGFTCPNRDGSKGTGGCSYCNNTTFKPYYCNLEVSVSDQIKKGIDFFSGKYKSIQYLAYFQAYTNTYAPLDDLKSLYEEALSYPGVIGLVVSTRPDALSEGLLDYFEELSKKVYVMIEFGVESHLDHTLELINRGHTFSDSVYAIRETARRKINNCAHVILGLPGESRSDILEQADVLSGLPIKNMKLHQLQIHEGTKMASDFSQSPERYNLYTADEYMELVVDYLERLSPDIIIERFISQAPPDMLIAPKWGLKNFEFVAKVEKRLAERDTWQGRLYKASLV